MYFHLQYYFTQRPLPVPSISRGTRKRPGSNRVLDRGNPAMQVSAGTRIWPQVFPIPRPREKTTLVKQDPDRPGYLLGSLVVVFKLIGQDYKTEKGNKGEK